jgi:maleate cis-trans isomerase
MSRPFRIGQIVPSSNTTMETEIPAILRAREAVEPDRFTFHSSRMRMKKVTKEELAAMDADSDRAQRSWPMHAWTSWAMRAWWPSWPWGRGITATRSSGCTT